MTTRRQIRNRVLKGETKDRVYAAYAGKVPLRLLRNTLATVPDPFMKARFNWLNQLLVLMILAGILADLVCLYTAFHFRNLLFVLISLVVLFYVARFEGLVYLPASVWFLAAIIILMKETGKHLNNPQTEFVFYAFSGLYMFIVMICVFIRLKIFRHFDWFLPARDKNGQVFYQ